MNRRVFVLAALALGGCATAPRTVVGAGGAALAELETLQGARAGREALTIRVASRGCTGKADFAFHVERKGGAVTLAFGRRRLDPCRSLAGGTTELSFTWAELGVPPGARVVLLNPLAGG
ncbi:hypothetical protein [Phenylobacterium sp.]|uniref:hypothetical protein n=1 Tax=Phenylobacterium sp. TaxID=1871053 RepID=UPI002B79A512|nr:hypothetical protein [Phenylobacterium sp.]HVI34072.1 hypothetical protein [Phenylobacterium sp.]